MPRKYFCIKGRNGIQVCDAIKAARRSGIPVIGLNDRLALSLSQRTVSRENILLHHRDEKVFNKDYQFLVIRATDEEMFSMIWALT